MKIALIGWSGNNNLGDERMYYCIKKYFSKHKIVRFKSFLEAILQIEKVNSCDFVLIGGGGLIFRGFNRYVDFLNQITKPMGCIGISIEAEGLNDDMRAGLEMLKDKAEFIYVRDHKSRKILNDHFKVIVGPDVTFMYPYQKVAEISDDSCALNLRDWFWWDLELHSIWHERLSEWNEKHPWIKYFYPLPKWNPNRLVKFVKQNFNKVQPLVLYSGAVGKTDQDELEKYFSKVPARYSLDALKKSRYLIGMRLHSLVFATQMGIPFISLSYEPKNVNYCIGLSHPELSLPLLDYKQIGKKIDYLKNNYDMVRNDLLKYTEDSRKQTKYIFESIEKLMLMRSKAS